jgi:hypothetical protein
MVCPSACLGDSHRSQRLLRRFGCVARSGRGGQQSTRCRYCRPAVQLTHLHRRSFTPSTAQNRSRAARTARKLGQPWAEGGTVTSGLYPSGMSRANERPLTAQGRHRPLNKLGFARRRHSARSAAFAGWSRHHRRASKLSRDQARATGPDRSGSLGHRSGILTGSAPTPLDLGRGHVAAVSAMRP